MGSIEVAKVDPKTGLPVRDEDGELVTHRVDPRTGAPVSSGGGSSLSSKRREELDELAAGMGIDTTGLPNKGEVIAAIEAAEATGGESAEED